MQLALPAGVATRAQGHVFTLSPALRDRAIPHSDTPRDFRDLEAISGCSWAMSSPSESPVSAIKRPVGRLE